MRVSVLHKPTGSLMRTGTGTIVSSEGHIITAAHNIIDHSTLQLYNGKPVGECAVLVGTYMDETSNTRWSYTAEVLTSEADLRRECDVSSAFTSTTLLDIAVLKIAARVECCCDAGIWAGPQQKLDWQQCKVSALDTAQQQASFEYLPVRCRDVLCESGDTVVFVAGFPAAKTHHFACDERILSSVDVQGGWLQIPFSAVTHTGMSGGPMLSSAGEVLGVYSSSLGEGNFANYRSVAAPAAMKVVEAGVPSAYLCSAETEFAVPLTAGAEELFRCIPQARIAFEQAFTRARTSAGRWYEHEHEHEQQQQQQQDQEQEHDQGAAMYRGIPERYHDRCDFLSRLQQRIEAGKVTCLNWPPYFFSTSRRNPNPDCHMAECWLWDGDSEARDVDGSAAQDMRDGAGDGAGFSAKIAVMHVHFKGTRWVSIHVQEAPVCVELGVPVILYKLSLLSSCRCDDCDCPYTSAAGCDIYNGSWRPRCLKHSHPCPHFAYDKIMSVNLRHGHNEKGNLGSAVRFPPKVGRDVPRPRPADDASEGYGRQVFNDPEHGAAWRVPSNIVGRNRNKVEVESQSKALRWLLFKGLKNCPPPPTHRTLGTLGTQGTFGTLDVDGEGLASVQNWEVKGKVHRFTARL